MQKWAKTPEPRSGLPPHAESRACKLRPRLALPLQGLQGRHLLRHPGTVFSNLVSAVRGEEVQLSRCGGFPSPLKFRCPGWPFQPQDCKKNEPSGTEFSTSLTEYLLPSVLAWSGSFNNQLLCKSHHPKSRPNRKSVWAGKVPGSSRKWVKGPFAEHCEQGKWGEHERRWRRLDQLGHGNNQREIWTSSKSDGKCWKAWSHTLLTSDLWLWTLTLRKVENIGKDAEWVSALRGS